ncbi:hypothetical protein [Caudoviricetes sp.]|nr:hypothetical protein [Caudoviricetes sp.]
MTKSEPLKVIVRFHKGDGEPILFFPTLTAKVWEIASFSDKEGHGMASQYFFTECREAKGHDQSEKARYSLINYEKAYNQPLKQVFIDSSSLKKERWGR